MPSKGPITPRLVIIEGKDKGKVIPLSEGTVVVGRTKGDVLVGDPRMSRSHVALHFDGKKLSFTDLKSLNHTLWNGETKESGELNDGDKLQLGDTIFDCQLTPTEEAPKPKARSKEREKEKPPKEVLPAIVESSLPRLDDPMEESMPSEMPAVLSAPGPTAMEEPPSAASGRSLFGRMRAVPKRTRMLALVVLLVAFAGWSLLKGGGPGTGGNADPALEKEVAAIRALEAAGKIDEALTRATALKDKYSDNSLAWLTLGNIYSAVKKNELAIAAYQKAKELPPPQPVAHVRLIRVYLQSQLTAEADEELNKLDYLIRKGMHSKELFVEAGQLFLEFKELKQPPEKTIILAKALQTELAPESAVGYKLEAQVLFAQNRAQEALQVLEKGLTIDPNDDWLLENVAFAKLSAKDVPGALTAVDAWLKSKPNATKALLVMAYLRVHDSNFVAGLPYVQKILEVAGPNNQNNDPHYAEALDLLGQIYLQQNNAGEAQTAFRQSCEAGFPNACERLNQSPGTGTGSGTSPGPASLEGPSGAPTGTGTAPPAGTRPPPKGALPPGAKGPADPSSPERP